MSLISAFLSICGTSLSIILSQARKSCYKTKKKKKKNKQKKNYASWQVQNFLSSDSLRNVGEGVSYLILPLPDSFPPF